MLREPVEGGLAAADGVDIVALIVQSQPDQLSYVLRRLWIGFVYVSLATPQDIVEPQEHIEHLAHEDERLIIQHM